MDKKELAQNKEQELASYLADSIKELIINFFNNLDLCDGFDKFSKEQILKTLDDCVYSVDPLTLMPVLIVDIIESIETHRNSKWQKLEAQFHNIISLIEYNGTIH